MMPFLALERCNYAKFAANGSTAKPEEGLVSRVRYAQSTHYYGGFDRRLLAGFYRAAYAHVVGVGVPENIFTTFGPMRRVREGEETTGALDVVAAPIEVSYRHNGAFLTQGAVHRTPACISCEASTTSSWTTPLKV